MDKVITVTRLAEGRGVSAALLAELHEASATAAYAHIFDTPFPREETQQRWAMYRGSVAVAHVSGQPVGFVAWHDDELAAVYVRPEAVGRGAGAALLQCAAGATRLWVLEQNHHARRFYEARGWRLGRRSRRVYGGVNEVEYVRA